MRKKKVSPKVAMFIPCFNEQRVIEKTIEACLKVVPAKNLYIVDDGSTDKTYGIARKYTKNVLKIQNSGKAHALNTGIKKFKLSKKYEYIFFMDADTRPQKDFLLVALKNFEKDKEEKIVCVSGRVKGLGTNWISKYRKWEYQVAYLIHKRAQSYISSILVAPGCATVYRSKIFNTVMFPTGTFTEDMDFTFLLHRKNMDHIVFDNKAIVYTIDPSNLRDFIKQISRWYMGFWQAVRKHDIPWGGQRFDLEVGVLGVEGLFNGMLVLFFVLSLFSLLLNGSASVLALPLLIDLFVFFIPSLLWSVVTNRDITLLLFIPHFYMLRFLSSIIFLKSFFDGFFSIEKQYIWDSRRFLERRFS